MSKETIQITVIFGGKEYYIRSLPPTVFENVLFFQDSAGVVIARFPADRTAYILKPAAPVPRRRSTTQTPENNESNT
jgi:hypothetical protein